MQMTKFFILLLLLATTTGCGLIYRQDVQQGNLIFPQQVAMLHTGMTKDEVRYLLGTPVMSHVLNCDRWEYVYTCKKGNGPMRVKWLYLYFNQCRLACVRENCCS